MSEIFPVIKAVLMDKRVLICAFVCVLLMNFASYVCKYKKKPPKLRIKKSSAPVAPAVEEGGEDGGDDGGADEE